MSRNATPFERFAAFNFGILAIPSSIHAAHSVEFYEFSSIQVHTSYKLRSVSFKNHRLLQYQELKFPKIQNQSV